MEKIALELIKISPIVAILCIAIWALWVKYDKADKQHRIDMEKKDKENRDWTMQRIDELKEENKKSEEKANEDRNMFRKAIQSFDNTTATFEQVATDIGEVKTELKSMQKDIIEIKAKVN